MFKAVCSSFGIACFTP
ncbi:hypothetical protein P3390_23520 [Vibrio parahaemolyticus]|nr:hypothetical protein [Vibrio parahaemolyticus]